MSNDAEGIGTQAPQGPELIEITERCRLIRPDPQDNCLWMTRETFLKWSSACALCPSCLNPSVRQVTLVLLDDSLPFGRILSGVTYGTSERDPHVIHHVFDVTDQKSRDKKE